jgi:SulP family sulfate permease
MISGATGALAVVLGEVFHLHPEVKPYLYTIVICQGVFQMMFGFAKLGKLIRLIPTPVMFGFVNGLAIVIFKAQFKSFKGLSSPEIAVMVGLILLVMAIIHFLPKLTKAVPSALVAIIAAFLIVNVFHISTPNVKSIVVTMKEQQLRIKTGNPTATLTQEQIDDITIGGKFPTVKPATVFPFLAKAAVPESDAQQIPQISEQDTKPQHKPSGYNEPLTGSALWLTILKTALILAAVGLIESLMTLTLIDEITQTRGRGNRESKAQGFANIITGLFGGMGGCAMIGQSIINVNAGGRHRLSGIVAALTLLLIILVGAPVIEGIPIAALIGVMFMVVIGTFEWETFNIIKKIPKTDVLVIFVVTVVTVFTDLAMAVIIGVLISAVSFAWESAKKISVKMFTRPDGALEYDLHGAIFFASTTKFKSLFDFSTDTSEIYIDFADARVHDHSGIEAINWITEQYSNAGKKLHLLHLSEDCRELLETAGDMIEVNMTEDPHYWVADDKLA